MEPSGRWLVVGPGLVDGEAAGRLAEAISSLDPTPDAVLFESLVGDAGPLDIPTVLGALSALGVAVRLGAVVRPGEGRAVSIAVRELTAVDLLALGGAALVLVGDDLTRLAEGAEVAVALQAGEPATTAPGTEQVIDAPNRPSPRTPGGFPIGVLGPSSLAEQLPSGVGFFTETAGVLHAASCILERVGLADLLG